MYNKSYIDVKNIHKYLNLDEIIQISEFNGFGRKA